ncbi:MAG: isocitrate lyase/phosphoenolpyruvate mutase family protein [Acidimicrobiales bacterium]
MDAVERATHLLALHRPGQPLLAPNPWDVGSAKLLESLGFEALCTTSSGAAATLGGLDGSMGREAAVASAGAIAAAVDVPVSADLENGFGDAPEDAAETIRHALAAGLSGGSIEDWSPQPDPAVYAIDHAAERVAAAAEAAHAGTVPFVLTARAENHIRGHDDLADTIARLQAYQAAGADVLYAPGLMDLDEIRSLVQSVDRPVNVIVRPGGPTVPQLADVGVARISVGGSLAWVAVAAVAAAAEELRGPGTLGFLDQAKTGAPLARRAFGG